MKEEESECDLEATQMHMALGLHEHFSDKAKEVLQNIKKEDVHTFTLEVGKYQKAYPTPAIKAWLQQMEQSLQQDDMQRATELLKQFE